MKQLELDLTDWDYVENWPHSADPYFDYKGPDFENDNPVCYTIEGHGSYFETREAAEQHRDFLCMTYGNQDGMRIRAVASWSIEYAR